MRNEYLLYYTYIRLIKHYLTLSKVKINLIFHLFLSCLVGHILTSHHVINTKDGSFIHMHKQVLCYRDNNSREHKGEGGKKGPKTLQGQGEMGLLFGQGHCRANFLITNRLEQ